MEEKRTSFIIFSVLELANLIRVNASVYVPEKSLCRLGIDLLNTSDNGFTLTGCTFVSLLK